MGLWGSRAHAVVAVLLASSACVGRLEEPDRGDAPEQQPQDPADPGDPPENPPPADACAGAPIELGPPRLWRISDSQYVNAVSDLLPGIEPTPVHTPGSSEYAFVNESELLRATGPLAYQYQSGASAAARQAGERLSEFLPCDPEPNEEACAISFIEAFASRAFRRPIDEVERAELLSLYQLGAPKVFESASKP